MIYVIVYFEIGYLFIILLILNKRKIFFIIYKFNFIYFKLYIYYYQLSQNVKLILLLLNHKIYMIKNNLDISLFKISGYKIIALLLIII